MGSTRENRKLPAVPRYSATSGEYPRFGFGGCMIYLLWQDAHRDAQAQANASGRTMGIERVNEFGRSAYRVLGLPKPENRYGFELRCELVEPESRGQLI
jgi:hypothetical protein